MRGERHVGGDPVGARSGRRSAREQHRAGKLDHDDRRHARAGARNLLEYRSAPAPTVTGSVTPAATVSLNPLLACCVSCPVTTTTTSTTSTTSTTATTVGTTSTTSSTIAVSTTTSTTRRHRHHHVGSPDHVPAADDHHLLATGHHHDVAAIVDHHVGAPDDQHNYVHDDQHHDVPDDQHHAPPTTSTTATTTEPTSTTFVTPTTTVQSSTSTSTSPAPVATTTTQPVTPSCGSNEVLSGASTCGVALLTAQVNGATLDQLGGKATANRLRAILRRADRFLDLARGGKNVGPSLRRALREIKSFERAVQRGLRRKRRPIDTAVGTSFLSLSLDARSEIGSLQASTR